jgi:lipid II:glycine glycyltransferase (peptidoglycan interpeptide bridge formation enzyme)
MTIRFATPDELTSWNDHIIHNPDNGNVFQGYELAEQKKLGGWIPRFVIADALAITILEKTVLGLGRLWYIPKGPGVASIDQLQKIIPKLRSFARRHGVFAVKIEPELPKGDSQALDRPGIVKVRPIQPNYSTVTIDLTPPIDDIMARLNQKGRHAIRRAERDGVTVRQVPASDEHCWQMYQLLAETAHGSFGIRDYGYYKSFWQRYTDIGQGQFFFAYDGERLIATAFAIVYGHKSTYKDGASVRRRTVYGASHLLQWHVIQWAKSKGSHIHDLCGSPPSDQIKNPDHPYYGIGRFKTSFNKEVTDYVGAYDLIVKPFQYNIWRKIGERLALKLHNLLYRQNYY